jgi:hypothetical protein
MLAGLLWLIVYDASFAAAYVNWISALCLLMLLPLAYGSVMLIRAWSKLMLAAQRPEFRRAHAGDELTADGHRPPDKKSE